MKKAYVIKVTYESGYTSYLGKGNIARSFAHPNGSYSRLADAKRALNKFVINECSVVSREIVELKDYSAQI